VVAGDVNQLTDREIVERTGLTQIVCQPTRGTNTLDKIYVSSPQLFFREHAHRTMFNGEESSTASISASIIQGSGIGPAAYTVTAADLKPLQPGNSLVKFADDAYLVVPSVNASTRQQEMDNIAT